MFNKLFMRRPVADHTLDNTAPGMSAILSAAAPLAGVRFADINDDQGRPCKRASSAAAAARNRRISAHFRAVTGRGHPPLRSGSDRPQQRPCDRVCRQVRLEECGWRLYRQGRVRPGRANCRREGDSLGYYLAHSPIPANRRPAGEHLARIAPHCAGAGRRAPSGKTSGRRGNQGRLRGCPGWPRCAAQSAQRKAGPRLTRPAGPVRRTDWLPDSRR